MCFKQQLIVLQCPLQKKMIHQQSFLIGEAKALVDGYGCNGSLYAPALARLEEHFCNPNRNVNAFLEKLSHFRPPNLTIPYSYTQFSAFLLTLVDTFQQLGFNLDIHSKCQSSLKQVSITSPLGMQKARFGKKFTSTISERAFGVASSLCKGLQRSTHLFCIS